MKPDDFIFAWLTYHSSVDILNQEFIDEFEKATNAFVHVQMWGANKCPLANKTLNKLYHMDLLSRTPVSLGANWVPSFPRWIYSYRLM